MSRAGPGPAVVSSQPVSCVISIGSNEGNRLRNLRRAIVLLPEVLSIARLSSVFESEPVNCPAGSLNFLNMVVLGTATEPPASLLSGLLSIESRLGRLRRRRNSPRTVDLDLIFYGAHVLRNAFLQVPHPRFRDREFVLAPMRELRLPWVDPLSGKPIATMSGGGLVRRLGSVYWPKPWASGLISVPLTVTEACLSRG